MSSSTPTHKENIASWKAKLQAEKRRIELATARQPGINQVLPPIVEGVLPNLPDPPLPGDHFNLLSAEKTHQDLPIIIPYVSHPTVASTISGTWDGNDTVVTRVTIPAGRPVEDQVVVLSQTALRESGVHTFIGKVENFVTGDDVTAPYTITIDHDRPNFGNSLAPVVFSQEVLDGITDEYLTQHNGITGNVQRWLDIARDDRIEFHWTRVTALGTKDDAGIIVDTQIITDPTLPITVTVPATLIRAQLEGTFVLWYQVFDRAGNDNAQMTALQPKLQVLLTPLPDFHGELLTLEKASTGTLLTREDLYLQAGLKLPVYSPFITGDQAQVYWDNMTVPAFVYSLVTDSALIPLPYSVVSSTGQDGTNIQVRVKVVRAQSNVGTYTNSIRVDYDLAAPGPDFPPGEPGPENSRLNRVRVKSASWQSAADDNKLLPGDEGEDATADVALIAGFTANAHFLALMWPGIDEPVDVQPITNAAVGQVITFDIPWQFILEGTFGPAVLVYYKVITDNPADGYQQSRTTLVDSQLGGIVDLPLPSVTGRPIEQFPSATPFSTYIVRCNDRYWEGFGLSIPPANGKWGVGAKFTATFQVYDVLDSGGTAGATETVPTPPYEATLGDVVNGFSYPVVFSDLLRASTMLRIEVKYNIDNAGQTGSSGVINLVMVNLDGGGNTCVPTP